MPIDPNAAANYLRPYLDYFTTKGIQLEINDNLLKRISAYDKILDNEEEASLYAFRDVLTQFDQMVKTGRKPPLESLPLNPKGEISYDALIQGIEKPFVDQQTQEQEVLQNTIFKNDEPFLESVQEKIPLMPTEMTDEEKVTTARLITAREEKGEKVSPRDALSQIYFYNLLPSQVKERVNQQRKDVEDEPSPLEISYDIKTGKGEYIHSMPEQTTFWDYTMFGEKKPYDKDLFFQAYKNLSSKYGLEKLADKSLQGYERIFEDYVSNAQKNYDDYKKNLSSKEAIEFEKDFKKEMGQLWVEKSTKQLKEEVSKSYGDKLKTDAVKGIIDGVRFSVGGTVMPDYELSISNAQLLADVSGDKQIPEDVKKYIKLQEDITGQIIRQTTQSLTFIATSAAGSQMLFGKSIFAPAALVNATTKGAKVINWLSGLGKGYLTGVAVGGPTAFKNYMGSPYFHNDDKEWWQKLGRGLHESINAPGLELLTETMFGSWSMSLAKAGAWKPAKAMANVLLGVTQEVAEEEISMTFDDLVRNPDVKTAFSTKIASGQVKDWADLKEQFIIAASTLLSFGMFGGVRSINWAAFESQWGKEATKWIQEYVKNTPYQVKENIAKKLNVVYDGLQDELAVTQSTGINSYVNNLFVLEKSLTPEQRSALRQQVSEEHPEVTDELTKKLLMGARVNLKSNEKIADALINDEGIISLAEQLKTGIIADNSDINKLIDDSFKANDDFGLTSDEAERVKNIIFTNLPSVLGDYTTAMQTINQIGLSKSKIRKLSPFINSLYAEDKSKDIKKLKKNIEKTAISRLKAVEMSELSDVEKAKAEEEINKSKEEALQTADIFNENLNQLSYSLFDTTRRMSFRLDPKHTPENIGNIQKQILLRLFGNKKLGPVQRKIEALKNIAEQANGLLGREYNILPMKAIELLQKRYGYFNYADKLEGLHSDIEKAERSNKRKLYQNNITLFESTLVRSAAQTIKAVKGKEITIPEIAGFTMVIQNLLDGKIKKEDAITEGLKILGVDTEEAKVEVEELMDNVLEEQKLYNEANKVVVKETKAQEAKAEIPAAETAEKAKPQIITEEQMSPQVKWEMDKAQAKGQAIFEPEFNEAQWEAEYDRLHPKPTIIQDSRALEDEIALLNYLSGLQNSQGIDNWKGARDYIDKNIGKDATLKQIHDYANNKLANLVKSKTVQESLFTSQDVSTTNTDKIRSKLKVGDKITFFAEKTRTGVWDGNAIREDVTNNPWGILAILSNKEGWIRIETKIEEPVEIVKEPAQIDRTARFYETLKVKLIDSFKKFSDEFIIPNFVKPSFDEIKREYNYKHLSFTQIQRLHTVLAEIFKEMDANNIEAYAEQTYQLIRHISNFRSDVPEDEFFLMSPAIRSGLAYAYFNRLGELNMDYLKKIQGEVTGKTFFDLMYKYAQEMDAKNNTFDVRYKHIQYHFTDARSETNGFYNQILSLLGFLNPISTWINPDSIEQIRAEVNEKLRDNIKTFTLEDRVRMLQVLEDIPAFFNMGVELQNEMMDILFETTLKEDYNEFIKILSVITGVTPVYVDTLIDENGVEKVAEYRPASITGGLPEIRVAKNFNKKPISSNSQGRAGLHEYVHMMFDLIQADEREKFDAEAMLYINRVKQYIDSVDKGNPDLSLIQDKYLDRISELNHILRDTVTHLLNIVYKKEGSKLVEEFTANFMGNNISVASLMYIMKPMGEETLRVGISLFDVFYNFSFNAIKSKLRLGEAAVPEKENLAAEYSRFVSKFYQYKMRQIAKVINTAREIQFASVVEDDSSEPVVKPGVEEYAPRKLTSEDELGVDGELIDMETFDDTFNMDDMEESIDPEHDFLRDKESMTPFTRSKMFRVIASIQGYPDTMDIYEVARRMTEEQFYDSFTVKPTDSEVNKTRKEVLNKALLASIPYKGMSNFNLTEAEIRKNTIRGLFVLLSNTENKQLWGVLSTKSFDDTTGEPDYPLSLIKRSNVFKVEGVQRTSIRANTILEMTYLPMLEQALGVKLQVGYISDYTYQGDGKSITWKIHSSLRWIRQDSITKSSTGTLAKLFWKNNMLYLLPFADKNTSPVLSFRPEDKPTIQKNLAKIYQVYSQLFGIKLFDLESPAHIGQAMALTARLLTEELKYSNTPQNLVENKQSAISKRNWREMMKRHVPAVHTGMPVYSRTLSNDIKALGFIAEKADLTNVAPKDQPAFYYDYEEVGDEKVVSEVYIKLVVLAGENNPSPLWTNKHGKFRHDGVTFGIKNKLGRLINTAHGSMNEGANKDYIVHGNIFGKHSEQFIDEDTEGGIGNAIAASNVGILMMNSNEKNNLKGAGIPLWNANGEMVGNLSQYKLHSFEDILAGNIESLYIPLSALHRIGAAHSNKNETNGAQQSINSSGITSTNPAISDEMNQLTNKLAGLMASQFRSELMENQSKDRYQKLTGHKQLFVSYARGVIRSPQGHLQAAFSDMFNHLAKERDDLKLWNEIEPLMYHELVYNVLVDYLGSRLRDLVKMTHAGNMLTLHSDPGRLAPNRLKVIKQDIVDYMVVPKFSPAVYDYINVEAKYRKANYEFEYKKARKENTVEIEKEVKRLYSVLKRMGDPFVEHRNKMASDEAYRAKINEESQKLWNRYLDENGFLKKHTLVLDQKSADRLGAKVGDTIIPAILPTDSAMGLYSGILIGILPNTMISDSAIILPSEYCQLVGKDFDLDKIVTLVYDSRFLSHQDWKTLAIEIQKMQEQYLTRVVRLCLKDNNAEATPENIKKVFIDKKEGSLLAFVKELYGEKKASDYIAPFSLEAFQLGDNYYKKVGYVVVLRQLHQYLGNLKLKIKIGNKEGNRVTNILTVDFGDSELWFKNHIGMMKLTNDQVDYPNPMDKDFYNNERADLIYAMFGVNRKEASREEKAAVDYIANVIDGIISPFLNVPRFRADFKGEYTRVQNTTNAIVTNKGISETLVGALKDGLESRYSAVEITTDKKIDYPLETIVNQVSDEVRNANFYPSDFKEDIIKNLTRKTEYKILTDMFREQLTPYLEQDFIDAVLRLIDFGISEAEIEAGTPGLRGAEIRKYIQDMTGREGRPKDKRFSLAEEKYMIILSNNIAGIVPKFAQPLISIFPFSGPMQSVINEELGFGKVKTGYGSDEVHTGDLSNLDDNSILVFGSNTQGKHGAGSAKLAKDRYRAVYGQPAGIQGQSYGIITKNLKLPISQQAKSIPEYQIVDQIAELYEYATLHPDLKFYIPYQAKSKNLNGYTAYEMARMFSSWVIPSNIVFEKDFKELIKRQVDASEKKAKTYLRKDRLDKYILLTNDKAYLDKANSSPLKITNNLNDITIQDIGKNRIVIFDDSFKFEQVVDYVESFTGQDLKTKIERLKADFAELEAKKAPTYEEKYRLHGLKQALTVLENENERVAGKKIDISDLLLRTNQQFGEEIGGDISELYTLIYSAVTGKTELGFERVIPGEENRIVIDRKYVSAYPARAKILPKMISMSLDNPNFRIMKSNMNMVVKDLNSDYMVQFNPKTQNLELKQKKADGTTELIKEVRNYKADLRIYRILTNEDNYSGYKDAVKNRTAELNRFAIDAALDFAHHNTLSAQDRLGIAADYINTLSEEQKALLPKVFTLMLGIPSTAKAAINLHGFGYSTANENLYRLMARYTPRLWRQYLSLYSKYNTARGIMYADVVEDDTDINLDVSDLLGDFATRRKISRSEFRKIAETNEQQAYEILKKMALDTDIRFQAAKLGKNYNQILKDIKSENLVRYNSIVRLGFKENIPIVAKAQAYTMMYYELKALQEMVKDHKGAFHLESYLGLGRKTLSAVARNKELKVYDRLYYNPSNPLFYIPDFTTFTPVAVKPIDVIDFVFAAVPFDPAEGGLRPFGNAAIFYYNSKKTDDLIYALRNDIVNHLGVRGQHIFGSLLKDKELGTAKDPYGHYVQDKVIDREKFEALVWRYEQLLNAIPGLNLRQGKGKGNTVQFQLFDREKNELIRSIEFNLSTGDKLDSIVSRIFDAVNTENPTGKTAEATRRIANEFKWLKGHDTRYNRAALKAAIQSKVVYHISIPNMVRSVLSYLETMSKLITHPTYKLEIEQLRRRFERYNHVLKVNTTEEREYVELKDGTRRLLRKFSPVVFDREIFIEEYLKNNPDKTYEDAVKITGFDTYYIPFFHNNLYSGYTRSLHDFNKDIIFVDRLIAEVHRTVGEVSVMAYHNNALAMGENQTIINLIVKKAYDAINPVRLSKPLSITNINKGERISFFTFEQSAAGNTYIKTHYGELVKKTRESITVSIEGVEEEFSRNNIKSFRRDLSEFTGVGFVDDAAIVLDKKRGKQFADKARLFIRDAVGVSILGFINVPRSMSINFFGSFFQALQEKPSYFLKIFGLSTGLGKSARVENSSMNEALKYVSVLGSVTLDVMGQTIDTEYSYYQESGTETKGLSKIVETLKIYKELLKQSPLEERYHNITSKIIVRNKEINQGLKDLEAANGIMAKQLKAYNDLIRERQHNNEVLKLLRAKTQFTSEEIASIEDPDIQQFFTDIQDTKDLGLFMDLSPKNIRMRRKGYLYRKWMNMHYAGMRWVEKLVRPRILAMAVDMVNQGKFPGLSEERALNYAATFVATTQGTFKWYQERLSKRGSWGALIYLLHSFTLHALDRFSRVMSDANYSRLLYGLNLNSYLHGGYIEVKGQKVMLNPQQNLLNIFYVNMVLFNLSTKIWGFSFLMNPVLYPFFFTIKYMLDALDPDDKEDTAKSLKFIIMSWIQLMCGWGGAFIPTAGLTAMGYQEGDYTLMFPRAFKDVYTATGGQPAPEVTQRTERDEIKKDFLNAIYKLTGFGPGRRDFDWTIIFDFIIPFKDDLWDLTYDNQAAQKEDYYKRKLQRAIDAPVLKEYYENQYEGLFEE